MASLHDTLHYYLGGNRTLDRDCTSIRFVSHKGEENYQGLPLSPPLHDWLFTQAVVVHAK